MDVNKNSCKGSIIAAFLVGLLAGFGVYRLWASWGQGASLLNTFRPSEESAETTDALSEETEDIPPLDTEAISFPKVDEGIRDTVVVNDQKADNQVKIEKVILQASRWVTIHEDRAGIPARILGAQRFSSGTHFGAVDLLRNTVANGVYYSMIHFDDGDGVFDINKDTPLKDGEGNPVMTRFTTSME